MSDRSPITKAIAELQTERAHLQTRLTKVDEAIATLRDLFHLPKPPMRPATARTAQRDASSAILAALSEQPLSPAELVIDRGQIYLQCACGAQTPGWVKAD